jgi:hypothetical protein
MKWSGIDASSRNHLPFLQFSCRTIDPEFPDDFDANGTTDQDFDRVLRYVGKGNFKVRRKKHPTLAQIRAHLKSGGAVALSYRWRESGQIGDHFCFIAGTSRGSWICINDHYSPDQGTTRLRKPKTVAKWIKRGKDYPTAWFLSLEK